MNFSLTKLRTNRKAFTFVEMIVAAGVLGVAGLIGISMLGAGLRLASQNSALNLSNFRGRQALDRLGAITRYAEEQPELITTTGAAASGSTADGIMVKNQLGGPYVLKDSTGSATNDILATAKTFTVEYVPANGVSPLVVGDWLVVEISTRPELQIATVGTQTASGVIRKNVITTTEALGELARPSMYRVAGYGYRKQAYVFNTAAGQAELRHYPRVTNGMSFSAAANYTVLGRGFQKLNAQPYFQATTINGLDNVWMRSIARSSGGAEHAEKMSGRKTLTTMPISVNLWNVGR